MSWACIEAHIYYSHKSSDTAWTACVVAANASRRAMIAQLSAGLLLQSLLAACVAGNSNCIRRVAGDPVSSAPWIDGGEVWSVVAADPSFTPPSACEVDAHARDAHAARADLQALHWHLVGWSNLKE